MKKTIKKFFLGNILVISTPLMVAGGCSLTENNQNNVLDSEKQNMIIHTIFNNKNQYCMNQHFREEDVDRIEYHNSLEIKGLEKVMLAPAIIFKLKKPIQINFIRFNEIELVEHETVEDELIFYWPKEEIKILMKTANNAYDQIIIEHDGYKQLIKDCFSIIAPPLHPPLEPPKPPLTELIEPLPVPYQTPELIDPGSQSIVPPFNHTIIPEISQAVTKLKEESIVEKIDNELLDVRVEYHIENLRTTRTRGRHQLPPNLAPHRRYGIKLYDIDDLNLRALNLEGDKKEKRTTFLDPTFVD